MAQATHPLPVLENKFIHKQNKVAPQLAIFYKYFHKTFLSSTEENKTVCQMLALANKEC